MSENTNLEWCDHTFNPWEGCQKVGPGCDHCYAETRNARFAGGTAINWGPGAPRRRTSVSNWELPKRWNAQADAFMARHGRRQRVFCASLADVFDNAVPSEWRMDLFKLIADTPNLDWLILTKRIGNVMPMCSGDSLMFDLICERVWLGATITSQAEADRDIPRLLAVPAAKRFLSMEPLLGQVDLRLPTRTWTNSRGCATCDHCCNGDRCDDPTHFSRGRPDWAPHCRCPYCRGTGKGMPIDWIIVGGESGPGARPMHPDWARSLRDQCKAAGVPFLFKQWGEWADMGAAGLGASGPVTNRAGDVKDWMRQAVTFTDGGKAAVQAHSWTAHATDLMYRVGKKAAGRLLDGITHDGYPAA